MINGYTFFEKATGKIADEFTAEYLFDILTEICKEDGTKMPKPGIIYYNSDRM